jgi:hypothetical protein
MEPKTDLREKEQGHDEAALSRLPASQDPRRDAKVLMTWGYHNRSAITTKRHSFENM